MLVSLCFNPRSRMGSDSIALRRAGRLTSFNPRSRMGSDPKPHHQRNTPPKFQSTLPHGERLPDYTLTGAPLTVSIHAPAWGATMFGQP